MVPLMTPALEMLRPAGNPVALNVSTSLASGSENEPDTSTLTTSASLLARSPSAVDTGASLVPVMVTVTVAVSLPPSLS